MSKITKKYFAIFWILVGVISIIYFSLGNLGLETLLAIIGSIVVINTIFYKANNQGHNWNKSLDEEKVKSTIRIFVILAGLGTITLGIFALVS